MFIELFSQLSYRLNLTLRDCEQCIRHFVLVLKNLQPRHRMFPETIALLILLRYKQNKLYTDFINRSVSAVKLIDFIDDLFSSEIIDHNLYLSYLRFQLYGFDDAATLELTQIAQQQSNTKHDHLAKRDLNITSQAASQIIDMQNRSRFTQHGSTSIQYIVNEIEICAPLQRPPWGNN